MLRRFYACVCSLVDSPSTFLQLLDEQFVVTLFGACLVYVTVAVAVVSHGLVGMVLVVVAESRCEHVYLCLVSIVVSSNEELVDDVVHRFLCCELR